MQGVLVIVLVLLVIPTCFASAYSPIISSLAGKSNLRGYADGYGGNALFNRPRELVLDPDTGDLYVADSENSVVRKIDSFGLTSTVYTATDSNDIWGIAYNPSPKGLFMSLSHKVIFWDFSTDTYKQIASNKNVNYNGIHYDVPSNTLFWTAYYTRVYYALDPLSETPTVHLLLTEDSQSWGLLVRDDTIYFGSTNKVIKFDFSELSSTVLAGSSSAGYANGLGFVAKFSTSVSSFALAPSDGALFVADYYNSLIRRVEFDGTTSTVAGVYQSTTFNPSNSAYSGSFGLCAVIYAHPLLYNFYYVSDEFGVRLWYWSPPLISRIAAKYLTSPNQIDVTWVNLVPANTIDAFTITVQAGLYSVPQTIQYFEANTTFTFPTDPQENLYLITLVASNIFGTSNVLSLAVQIPE